MQGLQQAQSQDDPLHVAACCKHFVANSLESWMGHTRHNFDARVSEADLQNYYFKPFQECVQAGAAGVMCSYNAINGVPACIHSDLLDTTLRQSWGFMGYLVTDCGALVDTITGHGAAKDPVDASAKAKRATVDVNCGDIFQEGLLAAYQAGLVQDSTIVDSFRRLARIQFRLGLFDPKEYRPDDAISLVGSHSQLALEAARQSIVLLKNTHNILPFDQNQKIAMIGPHIYGKDVFLSNYHGEVCPDDTGTSYDCMTTPVEVFSKATNHFINTTLGCHVDDSDLDEIDKAVEIAKEADIVVLLVGLSQRQEREEKDRTETVLPGLQQELINAVLNVACNKTVIAMIHGGAISLGHNILSKSAAILSASYGGMQGAQALADVMFGRYNPSGKLAATMYPASYVQDIPLTEMGLNVGVGRTHMYYSGTPEFSFGHGLSYSTWTIDWAKNESTIDEPSWALHNSRSSLMLQVNVTNVGPMKGSQNVLLFWRLPGNDRVRQKLAGFQGTGVLDVGESAALKFEISYQTFALWSEEIGSFLPDVGLYELEFRTSSGVLRHFVRVSLPTDNSTESTF